MSDVGSGSALGHHLQLLFPLLLLLPLPVELLAHHSLVVALVVVPQLLPVFARPVDLLAAGRDFARDGRQEAAAPQLIARQTGRLATRVGQG